jgi:hypothetical protein
MTTFPRWQKALTVFLIGVGLLLFLMYGFRLVRGLLGFRGNDGLRPGITQVEETRPWMTLEYVAISYSVPLPYLTEALGVPNTKEIRTSSLGQLGRDKGLEMEEFMVQVETALADYLANPVVTGLGEADTRPWMTLAYLANATGVPVSHFVSELGLPANEDWTYRSLRDVGRALGERDNDEIESRVLAIIAAYSNEP